MRVDHVSWRYWIILSLAIGGVIAWLHDTLARTDVMQSYAQVQFINMINRKPVAGGDGKEYPWIRSVTVYPATDLIQPYAKAADRKAQVTYELLMAAATKGSWQYVPKSSLVDDPIAVGGQPAVPLTTYLSSIAKDRPWVTYRYAFWTEPRWIYGLWVGGSLVLIGFVWPLVLRRLTLAGYAGREEEEKGPSFWKRIFARKAKEGPGFEAHPGARRSPTSLSAEDLQRIAAMEASLADFQMDRGPGGEVEDEPEPEIKKLAAGPLDTANQPVKQEEPKQYAGEFYPTETHAPKKKSD